VSHDSTDTFTSNARAVQPAGVLGTFAGGAVVGLAGGDSVGPDAVVEKVLDATVTVSEAQIVAGDGENRWSWPVADLQAVIHSADQPWTMLVVPGIPDFGVGVPPERVQEFRSLVDRLFSATEKASGGSFLPPPSLPAETWSNDVEHPTVETAVVAVVAADDKKRRGRRHLRRQDGGGQSQHSAHELMAPSGPLTGLDAREISAWFGTHQVLDRVSLTMNPGEVTALIGPSGCGKSTFLRILNRMHEMIPSASLAGEVLLGGDDIYDPNRKLTDARREIGMVFQKPNPFPAMSIYDNVLASFRLTGVKASLSVKDEVVESCLTKAGLWLEVRDRLRQPGGGLSGGQQQRLCIARALAIRPRVLLMDEPCSALDPTSTRRIEETIMEIVSEVTIVIVTHNMQQAARVSNRCAFFLAEQGTPGVIVEHGPTMAMFNTPKDPRTFDYVTGRFG
jgi:phosphate transport system ATP-binding protein